MLIALTKGQGHVFVIKKVKCATSEILLSRASAVNQASYIRLPSSGASVISTTLRCGILQPRIRPGRSLITFFNNNLLESCEDERVM